MRIYVASSWKNIHQQELVKYLREQGFTDVYDFKRSDDKGLDGFHWGEIHSDYKNLSAKELLDLFGHPTVQHYFAKDRDALNNCDVCILLLPCGQSAHIEAGYACGQGKKVIICTNGEKTDEIMYMLCGRENIVQNFESVLNRLEIFIHENRGE